MYALQPAPVAPFCDEGVPVHAVSAQPRVLEFLTRLVPPTART